MNGTVIWKFLGLPEWKKILDNVCFSKQTFYRIDHRLFGNSLTCVEDLEVVLMNYSDFRECLRCWEGNLCNIANSFPRLNGNTVLSIDVKGFGKPSRALEAIPEQEHVIWMIIPQFTDSKHRATLYSTGNSTTETYCSVLSFEWPH